MPTNNGTKISEATPHQDVRPPNPPWVPLVSKVGSRAALSFYHSDRLSETPIRDISHESDPKPDPNIETMTFGLFSHCDRGMRATIVKEGIELHFFCTNRGGMRVLTGYYRTGWYYKAPSSKKSRRGFLLDEYMLAAKEMKFVSPGFPLRDLTGYLYGINLGKRFRTFRYVDTETANRLLLLLKDTPDATEEYLSEIRRIEELVRKDRPVYQGKWDSFSWDVAPKALGLNHE